MGGSSEPNEPDFTEASSVYDTTGMSKHRLESHINAYYLDKPNLT